MKAKEFKQMTNDELVKKLESLKEELFNLRFQAAVGKLENTDRISKAKKIG